MKKIVLHVGGSSGISYVERLIKTVWNNGKPLADLQITMSKNSKINAQLELGHDLEVYDFKVFDNMDFMAPFASGSSKNNGMIVVPCSGGFLGRVASGMSIDLPTRAADVMLKERRKLVMVLRETPLSSIHIRNMLALSEAGAVILPAIPHFYSGKQLSVHDILDSVVHRVLDQFDLDINAFRWGS